MSTASTSTSSSTSSRPSAPSIHLRAFITWLAVFPLVAIGLMAIGPVAEFLHPVLRALVLTVVVVPVAVYLVVPQLFRLYGALVRLRRP